MRWKFKLRKINEGVCRRDNLYQACTTYGQRAKCGPPILNETEYHELYSVLKQVLHTNKFILKLKIV